MFIRAAVAVEYAIVILIVSVSAIGTVALLGRDVENVSARATASIEGAVANDPAPIVFTPPVFAPVIDVEPGSVVTSAQQPIENLAASAVITVSGGFYSINGGPLVDVPGTIGQGDILALNLIAAPGFNAPRFVTATIDGKTTTFHVTTRAAGAAPPDFIAGAAGDAEPGGDEVSPSFAAPAMDGPIILSGPFETINGADELVAGGFVSVNGGPYVVGPLDIEAGDVVAVSAPAPSGFNQTRTVFVMIDDTAVFFEISSRAADLVPDAFSIAPLSGLDPLATATSAAFSLTGFEAPVTMTVSGDGLLSVAGAAFSADLVEVSPGDAVAVRMAAPSGFGEAASVRVEVSGVEADFVVSTRAASLAPVGFVNFNAVSGVDPDTSVESNNQVLSGFEAPTVISVSAGAEYSVDGGVWVSAPGVVASGSMVSVRLTTGATFSAPYAASMTVGGVTRSFTATTRPAVTAPAMFANFAPIANAALLSTFTSSVQAISGLEEATPISVSGPGAQYSLAPGVWTSSPGMLVPGGTVQVRQTTTAAHATPHVAALTIGGVTRSFTVTTRATDMAPSAMTIASVSGITPSSAATSAAITPSGYLDAAPISVAAGGSYSINGADFTTAAGTIQPGDSVAVRLATGAGYSTAYATTLTIGGVSATFQATTRAASAVPTGFANFASQTGKNPSATITSNTQTVAGLESPATVSVAGASGKISINGATFITPTTATRIPVGATVAVQMTTGTGFSANYTTTVTIGGVAKTFTVTTRAKDSAPNVIVFANAAAQNPGTLDVASAAVTPSGYLDAAPVTVSGSGAQFKIGSGSWLSAAGFSILPGQTIQVRGTASSTYGATSTVSLSLGGVVSTFKIPTRAADLTPASTFAFPAITGRNISTLTESIAVTVTGIEAPANVTVSGVSGAEIRTRISGSASWNSWTTGSRTVPNNGQVQVRFTSSSSYSKKLTATVTVGTVSRTFSVTTRSQPVWVSDGSIVLHWSASSAPSITDVFHYPPGTPMWNTLTWVNCLMCEDGTPAAGLPSPGNIPSNAYNGTPIANAWKVQGLDTPGAIGTYAVGYTARPGAACTGLNSVQLGALTDFAWYAWGITMSVYDRLVCK